MEIFSNTDRLIIIVFKINEYLLSGNSFLQDKYLIGEQVKWKKKSGKSDEVQFPSNININFTT